MDTITKHSTNYKEIGIYKFFKYENVYKYEDIDYELYNIYYNTSLQKNAQEPEYYLILDTIFADGLFHWVGENLVFLPLYIELKKQHPALKIIFREKVGYHKSILEYYNISFDNILYKINNTHNVCFFPFPISHLNNPELDLEYISYADAFVNWLNNVEFDKTIENLIMPRQVIHNAPGNNRINDCTDIINHMPDAVVFHTDNSTNFYDQIKIVKSSKNIILTDGSPFLFNGLFAKDSTIIVLGDVVTVQGGGYKKMQYYIDIIKQRNHIIFIPYLHGDFGNSTFYYSDVKDMIK